MTHLASNGPPLTPLARDGFAVLPDVLSNRDREALAEALETPSLARSQRRGSVYGGRNLLALDAVRESACSPTLLSLIEPVLGAGAVPVRALYFDKTRAANWPVPWHQDLTVAVAGRHEIEGWGPWSMKAGIQHVQPPAAVLEAMLGLRLHLDDCGPHNGPLRVLPGTHRLGKLPRARIALLSQATREIICTLSRGAALLMRPLLLHASSPAANPSHRRVVHIEYAAADALPDPFRWPQL
jgi:hypothetical protein